MELGTLEALPITQFNFQDSCSEFYERVTADRSFLNKVHPSMKY